MYILRYKKVFLYMHRKLKCKKLFCIDKCFFVILDIIPKKRPSISKFSHQIYKSIQYFCKTKYLIKSTKILYTMIQNLFSKKLWTHPTNKNTPKLISTCLLVSKSFSVRRNKKGQYFKFLLSLKQYQKQCRASTFFSLLINRRKLFRKSSKKHYMSI